MSRVLNEIYEKVGVAIDFISDVTPPLSLRLEEYLQIVQKSSLLSGMPIVVPRVSDAGRINFYLIGNDQQQCEEVYLSLKAYLGESYTHCHPMTFVSSDDSFENNILDVYPQGFKRINVLCNDNAQNYLSIKWVIDSLDLAVVQYRQRPISRSVIKRPVGVILRHFFIAIDNELGTDAVQLYYELKNHQRLSLRNLLSLEMQALAAGGQWNKILKHQNLDLLMSGTIPRRLQKVLLKSVGHANRNSTVPSDHDFGLLGQDLQGLYPLFASPPDLDEDVASLDYWKMWAMGAVATGRTVATKQLPPMIDAAWISELEVWADITPADIPATVAVVPSLEVRLTAEMGLPGASNLLQEAIVANFLEQSRVFQRLVEYPQSVVEELVSVNPMFRSIWSMLKETHGEQIQIDDWHHLFEKLAGSSGVKDVSKTLSHAVEMSEYWGADSWRENQVFYQIAAISDETAKGTIRDILPVLLHWLEKHEKKLPSDAIEHFLILLMDDELVASEDLLLTSDLLVMLVSQPHSKAQYESALDCIESCWHNTISARVLDSILEIYEILLDYPCADQNRRLQSWLALQSDIVSLWTRLDNQNQRLCFELAQQFLKETSHLPKVVEEKVEVVKRVDLRKKILAIYTLTEGAGRRAKKALGEDYPGLEIRLNHDKTATNELLNIAKTADYFVFSAKSAAHQAFYPVANIRKDLIYPAGKGASSIVRSFRNAVAS